MKEIFFIRHGRQSSRLCNVDVSLDDAGRRQAALAAERLRTYEIGKLYTSGLKPVSYTHLTLPTIGG